MSLISNGFDYFGFHEIPTFVLCNPNKVPLKALSGITERKLEWNLNALSTLTFNAYPIVNDVEMEYYDLLKSKKLILVDELSYFIITSVKECDDGITKYKEITANSLEAELIFKKVNLVSGTYKFYDVFAPETSLLHKVLANCHGWTVGTVDSDLINKYRYFEVTDTTVYNFLMTTVEEAIECVFVFDTFAKTISAYTSENIIKPTNIYLSHDNLILDTEVNELTDELYTAMQVSGGGDLSIYTVNPLGNSYIYNFDYYKNTEWMSQRLIDALDLWDSQVNYFTGIHEGLIIAYYNRQTLLNGDIADTQDTGLYGELDTLKQELAVLEIEQASKVSKGESLTTVKANITAKNAEITAKNAQITAILDEITDIISQLGDINDTLSFENNLTPQELEELSAFIIETSYQNENFIQLDTMKPTQIMNQAQDLYNQAVKVLERISQPRYEFNIDSLNIIFMKEFEKFKNQLELGCEIFAEISPNNIHRPILLQIQLNYDDASDFSMTFGNRLRLDSSEFVFADLFGKAFSTSSNVALNSTKWNSFSTEYKDEVVDFMNSALDASKNVITTSENQDFTLGGYGIRGKTTVNGITSPKQLWMNNSMLAFTTDNWSTAQLSLGEILLPSGSVGYGLVADAIVGKLIAGNQLLISNANSSFLVDANGVTVTDANFTIKHTDGGTTTEQTLGDAFLAIDQSISDVTTEVETKMVTTFYQSTIPLDVKSGDLWYNTSVPDIIVGAKTYKYGKLYRYNASNAWDTIEDAKIAEAIGLAQDAKVTADGKICTYYANQKSVGDVSPNVTGVTFANGDLWINTTDNKNTFYRYNDSTHLWVLCKDKDIIDATNNISTIQTTISGVFKSNGVINASVLDGIIDTTKAYMTAVTNQVVFDSSGMWLMNNAVKNNATEAIWMNERGILLGKRSTTGAWLSGDFKTAITASGISADAINTGTLNAINIKGGSIFIGGDATEANCNFGVTTAGKILGASTVNGLFSVDKNGNVVINGNLILGGTVTWNTHDPNISTAQTTANGAVTTANSAVTTANSANTNINKLADGTYSGGTFIDGKSIESPTITGGIIKGGEYRDLYNKGKLILNPNNSVSNNADLYLYSGANVAFKIYDGISGYIDLFSYGHNFLTCGNTGVTAVGDWDFTSATVSGNFTAKFG